MVGENFKCFRAVLLSCVLVSAGTASTTNKFSSAGDCAVSVVPTTDVRESLGAVPFLEVSNSYLAQVAPQILKPPAGFTEPAASFVANTKSLPAVPAAALLVVTGFLCVTLVNDRKGWLAVLAGLLWAGQTGIQALPQLALRFGRGNHISQQQFDAKPAHLSCLMNSYRLRSDIEGTQYIGLLYYLEGIPDRPTTFLQPRLSFLRKQEFRTANYSLLTAEDAPQFAIINLLSRLFPATNCLASRAEQLICFSPAFIFANLARGPPNLTMRNCFSNLAGNVIAKHSIYWV